MTTHTKTNKTSINFPEELNPFTIIQSYTLLQTLEGIGDLVGNVVEGIGDIS